MAGRMLLWCVASALGGAAIAGRCGAEVCEDASLLQSIRRQAPETEVACKKGYVEQGVCVCESGWSGEACDQAEELVDDNGGTDDGPTPNAEVDCVHGFVKQSAACICDDGWAGEACDVPEEIGSGSGDGEAGGEVGEICDNDAVKPSNPVKMHVYPYPTQYWATNYAGWETCGGQKQSPITIWSNRAVRERSERLDVVFGGNLDRYMQNAGHCVQVNGAFGQVTIGGTTFVSSQFHIHTPAEHSVDGYLPTAELHIVSHNANFSAAAVVAILFDLGAPNRCLEALLKNPVPRAGCKRLIGNFDLSCFREQFSGPWWNYQGSLTTPPCLEVVDWNVMKRRATISSEQLEQLGLRYPVGNNREVQPLNGRRVVYKMPRMIAENFTKS